MGVSRLSSDALGWLLMQVAARVSLESNTGHHSAHRSCGGVISVVVSEPLSHRWWQQYQQRQQQQRCPGVRCIMFKSSYVAAHTEQYSLSGSQGDT